MRMFCKNCGEKIYNNDRFCPKCGTPVEINQTHVKRKAYEILMAIIIVLMIVILLFKFIANHFEHNINGKMDIAFGFGMTEDEFIKESGLDDFRKTEINDTGDYLMEMPEKGASYATEGNVITDIALWDVESNLCMDGIYVGQSFVEACEIVEERGYVFESNTTTSRNDSDVIYEGCSYTKNGIELLIDKDEQGKVITITGYIR